MQTHYPRLEQLAKKLASRRGRKRMGRKAVQSAQERLYLADARRRSAPGFARL
jgi:hypothetical protein